MYNSSFLLRTYCATFNHENYILDALNGFAMQQTSFPVVYTIVDDASTDGTAAVIKKFVSENFSLDADSVGYEKDLDYGHVTYAQHKTNKNCYFAVIYLKENHYSQKKSKAPYLTEWMDTKYLALCEGDDYWTDPTKLQKQVDYMESNPDCMLTVHSSLWQIGNDFCAWGCQETVPKDFSVEELIRCGGLYFSTASFMYRAFLSDDCPVWRKAASVGDFPLQILSGLRGKVHYLPEKMCIYRYRSRESWSSNFQQNDVRIAFENNKIEWMTQLDKETNHKYQEAIYDQLFKCYNYLFNMREVGFVDYARAIHRSGEKNYKRLVNDSIRIYLKRVYDFLISFKK